MTSWKAGATSVFLGGLWKEWSGLTPGTYLLACRRDTNDDALAPPLVACLQGSPHNTYVSRAIERVVTPSIRHLDQLLLDTFLPQLRWVDEIRSAELLPPGLLPVIHIHHDDLPSTVLDRTLYHTQPHAACPEYSNGGAIFHVRGYHGRAVAGRDAAAEEAGPVHGRFVGDGDNGDVRYDGVLREGAGAHEVQKAFAAGCKPGGAVGHDSLALGGADLAAEVRLAGSAEFAFAAFGGAERYQGSQLGRWSSGGGDRGWHTRALRHGRQV